MTRENAHRGRREGAVVPEIWREFYNQTHVPAAIKSSNLLRLTGHTGDASDGTFSNDVRVQIRQTFQNIAVTLSEGGSNWESVVEINSYHVGLQDQADNLLEVASEFLIDPYPAWTAVGVTELILPGAIIEISCVAHLNQ
jgi:enamine deaminase RidA (YjgF/YER057c/UK114 family)